ncbi:MAG TPA: hypothetical protein VNV15_00965 [Opitutaceae bacterium]|jgi:hypothetical protein|nr:hypothetical protein [Opitutaceae bacterium]
MRKFALVLIFAFALSGRLLAGAPFLTDDPVPVDYQHWEFYLSATGDRTSNSDTISGPTFELNYGVAPETHLHLAVPIANVSAAGHAWTSGLGDAEFGIKYRFLQETDTRPQIGVFPAVELPTGSASRGLGNGRAWFRLPAWLQKSYGPWTSFGGGGVALNSAPGQRSYGFGGWEVQRDLGPHFTLGAELFRQGADTDADRGFTAANIGGSLNFTQNTSLLFSTGRSFAGDHHTLWYLALYTTWSDKK